MVTGIPYMLKCEEILYNKHLTERVQTILNAEDESESGCKSYDIKCLQDGRSPKNVLTKKLCYDVHKP